MRFRAKLAIEQAHVLYALVTCLSRLSGTVTSHSTDGSIVTVASSSTANDSRRRRSGVGASFSFQGGGGGGVSVVRIDPELVIFSSRGKGGGEGDGIMCLSQVKAEGGLFLEHRIESAADNVILFEIDLTQLKIALQSILDNGSSSTTKSHQTPAPLYNSSAPQSPNATTTDNNNNTTQILPYFQLKLAKRNGWPCLCLDGSNGSVAVHHAIPVRIMKVDDFCHFMPPEVDHPDVQLELPLERPLKPLVERMKTICPHIYLEGSMKGELTLRIDDSASSIRTFYGKLTPQFANCKNDSSSSSSSSEPPATCTLKLDAKKLNSCLQWQSIMPVQRMVHRAVLAMVENEVLALHVEVINDSFGYLTYYVPVHFLSRDNMEFE